MFSIIRAVLQCVFVSEFINDCLNLVVNWLCSELGGLRTHLAENMCLPMFEKTEVRWFLYCSGAIHFFLKKISEVFVGGYKANMPLRC